MAESFDVAVIDETVWLYIKDELTGPVTVRFTVSVNESNTESTDDSWQENLSAETVPPDDTSDVPSEAKSRIKWKVKSTKDQINSDKNPMPRKNTSITAEVFPGTDVDSGSSTDGVKVLRPLKIPAIVISEDPVIQRIMMHEFSKDASTIDQDRILTYSDELTVQQRKLLATYDVEPWSGSRYVVFVTLQPGPPDRIKRMHMDDCHSNILLSNATFMVFLCKGIGNDITLACLTEYMFVGMMNSSTLALLGSKRKPYGDPNDWLRPDNANPPRFFIGALVCSFDTGELIWNQLFHADGKQVMSHNFIHGEVNTKGCWGIFRNFNWNEDVAEDFEKLYVKLYRRQMSKNGVRDKLDELGYSTKTGEYTDTKEICCSLDKFFFYDRNHAYSWFCRDILGIKFFSTHSYYAHPYFNRFRDCSQHGHTYMIEHNLTCEKNADGTLEHNLLLREDSGNTNVEKSFIDSRADDGKYVYHHLRNRTSKDSYFKPGKDLIVNNQFGFKAFEEFINANCSLSKDNIKKQTWADLFFYKSDAITDVSKMGVYYAPNT